MDGEMIAAAQDAVELDPPGPQVTIPLDSALKLREAMRVSQIAFQGWEGAQTLGDNLRLFDDAILKAMAEV